MISQRNSNKHAAGFLLAALLSGTAFGQESFTAHPSTQDPAVKVTLDTLKQWESDLSNWGRWGPHDQRGTLNLITPEKPGKQQRWGDGGDVAWANTGI